MDKTWTFNLFFSIKLLAQANFMGYNARVRVLFKQPDETMDELGCFYIEYNKILPEFTWESENLDATQKEFLELRAQSEVEKAIFESKTAARISSTKSAKDFRPVR